MRIKGQPSTRPNAEWQEWGTWRPAGMPATFQHCGHHKSSKGRARSPFQGCRNFTSACKVS